MRHPSPPRQQGGLHLCQPPDPHPHRQQAVGEAAMAEQAGEGPREPGQLSPEQGVGWSRSGSGALARAMGTRCQRLASARAGVSSALWASRTQVTETAGGLGRSWGSFWLDKKGWSVATRGHLPEGGGRLKSLSSCLAKVNRIATLNLIDTLDSESIKIQHVALKAAMRHMA